MWYAAQNITCILAKKKKNICIYFFNFYLFLAALSLSLIWLFSSFGEPGYWLR